MKTVKQQKLKFPGNIETLGGRGHSVSPLTLPSPSPDPFNLTPLPRSQVYFIEIKYYLPLRVNRI